MCQQKSPDTVIPDAVRRALSLNNCGSCGIPEIVGAAFIKGMYDFTSKARARMMGRSNECGLKGAHTDRQFF